MTRPNQGLSSLALRGGERETLGTRLASNHGFIALVLLIVQQRITVAGGWGGG